MDIWVSYILRQHHRSPNTAPTSWDLLEFSGLGILLCPELRFNTERIHNWIRRWDAVRIWKNPCARLPFPHCMSGQRVRSSPICEDNSSICMMYVYVWCFCKEPIKHAVPGQIGTLCSMYKIQTPRRKSRCLAQIRACKNSTVSSIEGWCFCFFVWGEGGVCLLVRF